MAYLRKHAFSFLIIGGAILAYGFPSPFVEIAGFKMAKLIVPLIQIIMFGMGTTLRMCDFVRIIRRPWPVAIGCSLQFVVMPVLGYVLCRLFGLGGDAAAGVILIGSAAGGVASNVMAYIAGGNVALSVSMTTVSTLLSPVMTPLLMRYVGGRFIEIDMIEMALSLVEMIIVPLAVSQLARFVFDRWLVSANRLIEKSLPALSMTAICVIVTICVAAAHEDIRTAGAVIFAIAIIHNGCGYFLGYWGARSVGRLVKMDERDCRTVAIEVGMQNAGMSQAIAINVLKSAGAAIAPAIFGVWMDFSGSILANWWSKKPGAAMGSDPMERKCR